MTVRIRCGVLIAAVLASGCSGADTSPSSTASPSTTTPPGASTASTATTVPFDTTRATLLVVEPSDANELPLRSQIEASRDQIVDLGTIDLTLTGGYSMSQTTLTAALTPADAVAHAIREFPASAEIISPTQHGVALGTLGPPSSPDDAGPSRAGRLVYVVIEPRIGIALSGGGSDAASGANVPPTIQLSDRYIFLDATNGKFLGATEVVSGTDGSPPT